MSAMGQKQTYAVHQPMSALLPIATAKADFRQEVMSALPPKADMCGALAHVCFGPKADIGDYSTTSSAIETSAGGIASPSVWAAVRLMTNSNLLACCTGRSAGFAPLRILPT